MAQPGLRGAAITPKQLSTFIGEVGGNSLLGSEDALAESEEHFLALYATAPQQGATGWLGRARESDARRETWILELAILRCLDRLLQDSLRPAEIALRTNPLESPFRLADILVASTYGSFNAAYVYPQFVAFHELFALGAWLGNLLRGRAALMPLFVAEQIVERMENPASNIDTDLAECDRFLSDQIDVAVGTKKLGKIARRVIAGGRPATVHPTRRAPVSSDSLVHVWNEALFREIAASLKAGTIFHEHVPCSIM
jgi:hypothetical protein